MENRERDRVSKRDTPTEAGEINRQTEQEKGREQHSGTSAEFGQNIGRSEHLSEGGTMENRNKNWNEDELSNKNMGNESSRRSGSGEFGSSSGRSGSMGKESESSISRDQSPGRRGSSDDLGSDVESSKGSSSEGRH